LVGVTAGLATNHGRDRQFGDRLDADGALIGAYALYDGGSFYARGVATYSRFDGDSTRTIAFGGLAAEPHGDPDVSLFTLGLHGGARVPLGAALVAQPHVELDHVRARLDGFTEAGDSGAELKLGSSRSARTFLTGGFKLAGRIGRLLPEVDVAYRYRFGNARTSLGAAFAGEDADPFGIVSAAQDRGSLLAGLSVGGKLGKVHVQLAYRGEFSGDVESHGGQLKLVLPLGPSGASTRER
jgi:outer membrane autotransporter protein